MMRGSDRTTTVGLIVGTTGAMAACIAAVYFDSISPGNMDQAVGACMALFAVSFVLVLASIAKDC